MLSFTELAVTDQEATAYIDARALTGWPEGEAEQEAALRRGQDWVAREYNDRFTVEFENDGAPDAVQFAVIEAALAEARDPGFLSRVVRATDAKVLTQAGQISWTPTSGPGGVEALRPRLLHVEAILKPYIGTNVIYLERA